VYARVLHLCVHRSRRACLHRCPYSWSSSAHFLCAPAHASAPQEARPLLSQSIQLVEEVTPLLRELREGGLVTNVEALTSTAAAAAADIQRLQVRAAMCAASRSRVTRRFSVEHRRRL